MGDMHSYFVIELVSHSTVFPAELLLSVPKSVISRVPEETYLFDTLL